MSKAATTGGSSAASPAIVWNEKAKRFETEDREAYLQYHLIEVVAAAPPANSQKRADEATERTTTDQAIVMDMVHTYVPRSKRGLGVAARLCDSAFAHARRHSMLVIPTCSYISETFLPRNPGWNSVIFDMERRSSI